MRTSFTFIVVAGAVALLSQPCPSPGIGPSGEGIRDKAPVEMTAQQKAAAAAKAKDQQAAINKVADYLDKMGRKDVGDKLRADFKSGTVYIGKIGANAEVNPGAIGLGRTLAINENIVSQMGTDRVKAPEKNIASWALTVFHEYVHMKQWLPMEDSSHETPAWGATIKENGQWIRKTLDEIKRVGRDPSLTPQERVERLKELRNTLTSLQSVLNVTLNDLGKKVADGEFDKTSKWQGVPPEGCSEDQGTTDIDSLKKNASEQAQAGEREADRQIAEAKKLQQDKEQAEKSAEEKSSDSSEKEAAADKSSGDSQSAAADDDSLAGRVNKAVAEFKKSLEGKTPEEVQAIALNLSKAKHRGQWDQDDPAARLILEKKIEVAENWKPEMSKTVASAAPTPKTTASTKSANSKADTKSLTKGAAKTTTTKTEAVAPKTDLSAPWGHDDEMARMKAASGQVYRYGVYKNCKTVADVERMIEKREAALSGEGAFAAYVDDGSAPANGEAASSGKSAARDQVRQTAKEQGCEVAKEQGRSAAASAAATAAADAGRNAATQAGRPPGGPPTGCSGPCR